MKVLLKKKSLFHVDRQRQVMYTKPNLEPGPPKHSRRRETRLERNEIAEKIDLKKVQFEKYSTRQEGCHWKKQLVSEDNPDSSAEQSTTAKKGRTDQNCWDLDTEDETAMSYIRRCRWQRRRRRCCGIIIVNETFQPLRTEADNRHGRTA